MGDRARERVGKALFSGTLVLRTAEERVEVGVGSDLLVGRGRDAGLTIEKPGSSRQPFRNAAAPPPVALDAPLITIGKASDNDVVLEDINVSRHHARLYAQDDGFLVEDLNSLNGTLLNAVPIQRGFMREGDRL